MRQRIEDYLPFIITVGPISLVLVFAFVWFLWADTHVWVVEGHSWQNLQNVEDFNPRQFAGWDETVPDDARDNVCESKRRGSQSDGHGNSWPTFDQWCTYTADRWGYAYTLRTSGEGRLGVYPPPIDFNGCADIVYGCRRLGAFSEFYTVHFIEIIDAVPTGRTCDVRRTLWAEMPISSTWSVKMGVLSGIPWCDTLQRIDDAQG